MRKFIYGITGSTMLLGVLLICGIPSIASAGVNVGIGINIGPPPIVVPAPPEVVLVPGSQVYFVPGVDFDVFFYNGYWWSPRGDRWYRAQAYNGPWGIVNRRFIPRAVFRVPHDYRRLYGHERHIPYGEWRGHRGMGERHGGEFHDRGGHGGGYEHGGGRGHGR
jgi:uncharacterized membrane protein YgcG